MHPSGPLTLTLEVVSIILSVVASIVTVLGFFASLKFYRDGIDLQQSASDALTVLTEKTTAMQTQVGSMFDRTLEAAIGKRWTLDDHFAELESQVTEMKQTFVSDIISQVGEAGDTQRVKLEELVNDQVQRLRETVEETKESAQDVAQIAYDQVHHSSAYDAITTILDNAGAPISRSDINDQVIDFGYASASRNIIKRLAELRSRGIVSAVGEGRSAKYALTEFGKAWVSKRKNT